MSAKSAVAVWLLFCAALASQAVFAGTSQDAAPQPAGSLQGSSPDAVDLAQCDAGGRGATSCEIGHGLAPYGIYEGCAISCDAGTYACCNLGDLFYDSSCDCLPDPWNPPGVPPQPDEPEDPDEPGGQV